jgi:transketolase
MRDELIQWVLCNNEAGLYFLTADLGYGCFDVLEKNLQSRYINVGVCEQNMVNIACGICSSDESARVVVYSIGNFPTLRCLDQIRNGLAYHKLKCLIVSNGAGYSYGQLGATHHATEDFGVMRSIPEVEIYVPAQKGDTTKLMSRWLNSDASVGYIRLDKKWLSNIDLMNFTEIVEEKDYTLFRNGKDATTLNVVVGGLCSEAGRLTKSEDLMIPKVFKKGLNKRVLNVLAPYSKIIVYEEHNMDNGFGCYIAQHMAMSGHKGVLLSRSIQNQLSSVVGDQDYMRIYQRLV